MLPSMLVSGESSMLPANVIVFFMTLGVLVPCVFTPDLINGVSFTVDYDLIVGLEVEAVDVVEHGAGSVHFLDQREVYGWHGYISIP
jgi:hypothetical protein